MATTITILLLLIVAVIVIRKRRNKQEPQHLGEMTSRDVPAEMKKNYARRKKQYPTRKTAPPGYTC